MLWRQSAGEKKQQPRLPETPSHLACSSTGGDTSGDGGEDQRKEQREDMRGELNHGTLELVKYSE